MDLEESRICGRLSCIQVLEFLNVTGKMRHGYIGEVWEGKNTRVLTGYSLAMPKLLAMTSYNNKKIFGSIIQKSFQPLT